MSITPITDATFKETVATGTCLVVFTADWCGPSKLFMPNLQEYAEEYNTPIYLMDIDKNNVTPALMNLRGLPTTMLFNNGNYHSQLIGIASADRLFAFVAEGRE